MFCTSMMLLSLTDFSEHYQGSLTPNHQGTKLDVKRLARMLSVRNWHCKKMLYYAHQVLFARQVRRTCYTFIPTC